MDKFDSLLLGIVLLYFLYRFYVTEFKNLNTTNLIFNVLFFTIALGFAVRLTGKGLGIYNPKYTD